MVDHHLPYSYIYCMVRMVIPSTTTISLTVSDGCWYDRAADRKWWVTLFLQCMDHQQDYLATGDSSVVCVLCDLHVSTIVGETERLIVLITN